MVRRLRPTMLDDLGLAEAIEGELAVHARRQGWQVRLEVEPQDFPILPPQLATACFRIAQEALANAAWHAHARHVQVALRAPAEGGLVLTVEDDGVGFDVEQQLAAGHEADSFGLLFMRERARQVGGVVDMRGGSGGQGVRVQLSVPDWRVSAV
jgi:signal transduction histidine kinase